MKVSSLSVLATVVLISLSCRQSNPEKEQESILSVLSEESAATLAGDFEKYRATHIQDDLETRIEMGIYGYRVYKGWEEVSREMSDYIEGHPGGNVVNRKENVIIKVTNNTAWLTCDNIWISEDTPGEIIYNNLQITFFEKVKGEWKISFSAYYSKEDVNESLF